MRSLFDAHLDLAYLAECGRDMRAPLNRCGGPHPPAAVTFRSLGEGDVTACLGTIFTEPDGADAVGYPAGDIERAHAAGLRQLERYHAWASEGVIEFWNVGAQACNAGNPLKRGATGRDGNDGPARSTTAEAVARTRARPPKRPGDTETDGAPIRLGILIEGADPVRSPDELSWWAGRGVVAAGLTWAHSSRYAGGNSPETGLSGLSDLGRAMVRAMDSLGVVHDVSHLSDRAMDELLSLTDRPVIASHSNCRALLGGVNQRHLRDESIKEIARRGGVIGLNLVRNFIRTGLNKHDPNDRPSIEDAVRHVEHICEIAGHRRAVGLGTDLDGGISAHELPAGIDSPRDLVKLSDSLRARGWTGGEIHAFEFENWARFFRIP